VNGVWKPLLKGTVIGGDRKYTVKKSVQAQIVRLNIPEASDCTHLQGISTLLTDSGFLLEENKFAILKILYIRPINKRCAVPLTN